MRSVEELRIRRTVCDGIIRVLMDITNDPRQPDALAHYREQLKKLDDELTEAEKAYRKENGIPEPEPITVGLKPAIIFGKADRS